MKILEHIGRYFMMLGLVLKKRTKTSVMRRLIINDINDLILGSLGIVAFLSFFVGDLLQVQMAIEHSGPSHLGLRPPQKVHKTKIVGHPKIDDKMVV